MAQSKLSIIVNICNKFMADDPNLHYMQWRGQSVLIPELSSIIPNCNAIEFNGYQEAKRLYLKFVNIHIDYTHYRIGSLEHSVVTTYDKLPKEQKEVVGKFLESLKPVKNEYCAGFYWQTMRTA